MNCLRLVAREPKTVTITEDDLQRDRTGCLIKAFAARERGAVVECPWHFYYMAESHPRFRRPAPPAREEAREVEL